MQSFKNSLLLVGMVFALGACPAGGVPGGAGGMPGGSGGGVSPDSCGDLAAKGGDVGRKLNAFLEAAATLDAKVSAVENTVKDACLVMGAELGMAGLEGDTKTVCNKVAEEIRGGLKAGLKAEAKFVVNYKPAECKVDANVAASAVAQCEAKAEADVQVTCEGTCGGTCEGKCNGTCKAKNADGSCKGECEGTCEGSCSGSCNGHATASGSAECQASAEVKANLDVQCTEPEILVNYDAKLVVDKDRLEKTIGAIKKGLPKLLAASARAKIALKALVTFGKTAKDLAGSASEIASAFGDAAFCVTGQLAAAAKAVVSVEVKIEVSVEASAEVGGACGASSS